MNSDRFDRESIHLLKVLAVVREYCYPIVQAGRGDQEIEVADELACFSEPAAFSPEHFAHLFVDAKHGDIFKKGIKRPLALFRIP